MKTKNLIVEIISDGKFKRYFIVREIVPGSSPVTIFITDSSSEMATFLNDVKCSSL